MMPAGWEVPARTIAFEKQRKLGDCFRAACGKESFLVLWGRTTPPTSTRFLFTFPLREKKGTFRPNAIALRYCAQPRVR